MRCSECELLLAQGDHSAAVEGHLADCENCRTLQGHVARNGLVLESLRSEELPRITVRVPRPRRYVWLAVAAAAGFLVAMLVPGARQPAHEPAPQQTQVKQPLRIKMLTSDPSVVIYWLVDNPEGE